MPLEVFPVAIGEYAHHDRLDVQPEVARIVGLLADFDARETPWPVPMTERGGDAVDERLSEWSASDADNGVLYWVGHGWSDTTTAALAHAKSPRSVRSFGVTPSDLANHITARENNADEDGWLIVIIDACRSARFAELLNAAVDDAQGPRRLLLIGVSSSGATTLGRFGNALQTVLRATFRADPEIDLWRLWAELKRNLPGSQVIPKNIEHAVLRRTVRPVPVAAALDLHTEFEDVLSRLTTDERRHFIPKAQGGEIGELSWYFEGRQDQRRQIVTWLRESTGMLVVTGTAGSGKSALLGDLVMRSRSALRRVLEAHKLIDPLEPHEQPPEDVFDVVLHLTGMTPADVVRRIAADLGIALGQSRELAELVANLCTGLAGRQVTIVVDALDESASPLVIARRTLRQLSEVDGTRIVVGTRRSTREGPDEPDPADHDLLRALGPAEILTVERDGEAIERYVRRRLTASADAGRLGVDRQVISAAAAAIGAFGKEFLFARLAIHEAAARPGLLSPAGLADLLQGDHRRLFALAVERLQAERPAFGGLLRALGYARGRGLPVRDGIWSAVATALSDEDTLVVDEDINALLVAAAPYVMLDREHDQSVYRLAHRTFAEHFGREPEFRRGEPGRPQDQQAHLRIAHSLLECDPNPYVTTYTSAHAGLAGRAGWELLAQHPAALDMLDPHAVSSDAMRTAFGRMSLPPAVAAVIDAHDSLRRVPPADRSGVRQLAMARHAGVTRPGEDIAGRWTVAWARLGHRSAHLAIAGRKGGVWALTAFPGTNGRTLLASAGDDSTVQLWDPATSTPIGETLTGHSGWVRALAAVSGPDGQMVLASAGDDHVIRLWDPLAGTEIGTPLTGHMGYVRALAAVPGPDGRTLLASAGDDRTVRLWDIRKKTEKLITRHDGWIAALAVVPGADGELWLAAGGSGGTIILTNLRITRQRDQVLTHQPAVWALTAVPLPDGRVLLASGGGDGLVRLWNPRNWSSKSLDGHSGWVRALAVLDDHGERTLLASGGNEGTVRFWDPGAEKPVGTPLTGHSTRVRALAAVPGPAGQVLLASGDDDTVRLWDPAAGAPPSDDWPVSHTGAVRALALPSASVLASGGNDGVIRLWDTVSGGPVGEPLTGHHGRVRALTALPGEDGRTVLVSGGNDGTVRLWDLASGTQIGGTRTDHQAPVWGLAAVPQGTSVSLASAGDDETIRFWSTNGRTDSWRVMRSRTGWLLSFTTVTVGGQPWLITGSTDGEVRLWRPERVTRATERTSFTVHHGPVRALTAMPWPGGRAIVAVGDDDGTVSLWDVTNGRNLGRKSRTHTGRVQALAHVPGPGGASLVASAGEDGVVKFWTLDSGTLFGVLHVELGEISAVLAVGQGRVALGTSEGVCVLDVPWLAS